MNILLIFFALPVATIIISIALQKIFKCPALVAAIVFAIFLIVTFIINNLNFLIATIVYTIISFITASIVCLICRILRNWCNNESRERRNCCNNGISQDNVFTIANGSCNNNGNNNNVMTIGTDRNTCIVTPNSNYRRVGCNCSRCRRN